MSVALADKRPTATVEDYLAAMYMMERDGAGIMAARLAETLCVAAPTVTVTLRRMERDGWITGVHRRCIRLTGRGRQAAQAVVRKHMLVEWLLAQVLQVPWSRVHLEAHMLEHALSNEVTAQLAARLSDPQVCPHGNPLPGSENVTAGWQELTGLAIGAKAIVRRILEAAEDQPDLLRFFENNGLVPGAAVIITEKLPFNETLTVLINERPITLGFAAARYIWVEVDERAAHRAGANTTLRSPQFIRPSSRSG